MQCDNPRELPGFKKESYSLNYAGGEIWFEHLDGIYGHSEFVIEKLHADREKFLRPSSPAFIGVVLNETIITGEIIAAIADAFLNTQKIIRKVGFIGADKKAKKALGKALKSRRFALGFFDDFELAKEWLV